VKEKQAIDPFNIFRLADGHGYNILNIRKL